MVTIEVDLKEGDKEPEQHLEEGEHIERRIVPLADLYDTLHGKLFRRAPRAHLRRIACNAEQYCRKRRARSWMPGKQRHVYAIHLFTKANTGQALPLGTWIVLEQARVQSKLTGSSLRSRRKRLCPRHLCHVCGGWLQTGKAACRAVIPRSDICLERWFSACCTDHTHRSFGAASAIIITNLLWIHHVCHTMVVPELYLHSSADNRLL